MRENADESSARLHFRPLYLPAPLSEPRFGLNKAPRCVLITPESWKNKLKSGAKLVSPRLATATATSSLT